MIYNFNNVDNKYETKGRIIIYHTENEDKENNVHSNIIIIEQLKLDGWVLYGGEGGVAPLRRVAFRDKVIPWLEQLR